MPHPSVLLVHNHYQKPGGEDEVVRVESAMLRSHGHDVHEFRLHNDAINDIFRRSPLTVNYSLIGTGVTPDAGGNNVVTDDPQLAELTDNGVPFGMGIAFPSL